MSNFDTENAFQPEGLLGQDYVNPSGRVSCEGLRATKGLSFGQWMASIAIEAALATLWVAIFYIYVMPPAIESTAVSRNVKGTMDSVIGRLTAALTPEQVGDLSRELQGMQAPDMAAEDAAARRNNKKLTRQSFTIVGPACGGILLLVLTVYLVTRAFARKRSAVVCPGVDHVDLWMMLKVAGLATLCMMAVYLSFSFLVATRYRSVDPAVVERTILETLIDFGEAA